ncbi:MAG: hypothetical protein PF549_01675 [Patescibacteria group bacterium]|jgi:hypothetical protein|nr:hypothetical protein [Patescibacteria group bacterium]
MQEENKNEEKQNNEKEVVLEERKAVEEDIIQKENEDEAEVEGNIKLKLTAFFIVAVLVGIVIKNQATETITTGFDDYKIAEFKSDFNLKEENVVTSQDQQEEGFVIEKEETVEKNEEESK